MTAGVRILAVCLIVTLAFSGPFAPTVFAQQPGAGAQPVAPPPPPPAPPGPAAPGVQPAPPQVFPEAVKSPVPGYAPPMAPVEPFQPARGNELPEGAYQVAAGVTTMFFAIPGRTITCLAGTAAFIGILGLTLGTAYRGAAAALNEGCGGKWVVTADDLRPQPRNSPVQSERW
jgi:hypothetical protein